MFPVESVAAVRKQLADRGCQFVGESHEVAKGMWAATFTDPDGHRLTLFGHISTYVVNDAPTGN